MNLKSLFVFFVFISSTLNAEHFVFNLTGTFHGNGDVVGAYSIASGLKKHFPEDSFTLLTDERAERILKEVYTSSLEELSQRYGIVFVNRKQIYSIPRADYSFETFFSARVFTGDDAYEYLDMPYSDRETLTFVCNTMHESALDEIRMREYSLYFKPPGLGSMRSGIVEDPSLQELKKALALIQKTGSFNSLSPETKELKRREELREYIADHFFSDKPLLAQALRDSRVQLAFGYGTHNEAIASNPDDKWQIKGQTDSYLSYLDSFHNSDSPVLYITPNSAEDLEKASKNESHSENVEGEVLGRKVFGTEGSPFNFEKISREGQTSIFLSGGLNTVQFASLVQIADFPLWFEGNNSISTAILLKRPFMIIRSHWNYPMLEDLIEFEESILESGNLRNFYPESADPKIIEFANNIKLMEGFYQALFTKTNLYADKLFHVLSSVKAMRHSLDSDYDLAEVSAGLSALSFAALSDPDLKDPVFAYSIALVAQEEGRLLEKEFEQIKEAIEGADVRLSELSKQMVHNLPNESAKISASNQERGQNPIPVFLEEGKKYLFLEIPRDMAGLGNRLQAMVSAKIAAEANGRELVVGWPVDKSCPARYTDLYASFFPIVTPHRMIATLAAKPHRVIDPWELQIADLRDEKYRDEKILSMKTQIFFADKTLFENKFELLKKELRKGLKSLKILPQMSAKLEEFKRKNFKDDRIVGVHFRSWSKAVGDGDSGLRPPRKEDFFEAMKEELELYPGTRFFVAADNMEVKKEFLQEFPAENQLIFSDLKEVDRNSVKGVRGGLYEMMLLSSTNHVIGTTMSSFSDLAGIMSEEGRKITIGDSPYGGYPLSTFCFERPSGELVPCKVEREELKHYRPRQ